MRRTGQISRFGRSRKRAFTLVELLLAATTAALVTGAAAALTSAVANAATQTRDIRKTKTAGYFALSRIGQVLREARGIGQVTPTAISLWVNDDNNDDTLNLYESAVIRYDSTNKRIIYEYLEPPGANPTTILSLSDFKIATNVLSLYSSPDRKSVVWAEGVESLAFAGQPDFTDTRIVEAKFTIGTGTDAASFTTCASPRASADYLFVAGGSNSPQPGSTRLGRKVVSKFTGLTQQILGP